MDASPIRRQLERILASSVFRDAGRIGPLLTYLVEKKLAGDSEALQESQIGVELFQRPSDHDPRLDPVVRNEIKRLRTCLEEFYIAYPTEPVMITLPKGSFQPAFAFRQVTLDKPPKDNSATPKFRMTGPALVFLIVTVVSFGIAVFMYLGKKAVRQTKPAIAVLPFRNASGDAANQAFSDGLTIELIDSLNRIESMKVVSWSNASRFRGKANNLDELRTQLNAGAVLDGSFARQGDKLHVTARLIDTAKGNAFWSQTWDRDVKDVFRIQEEIAKSIVFGLRVQMSADPDQVLVPPKASKPEVYNDYLLARSYRNNPTPDALRLSSEHAAKAIAADASFAPPYGLLALNTVLLTNSHNLIPDQDTVAKAKDLAAKAIKLDPKSAEGHAAYGAALAIGEWKYPEARDHLLKAIQLSPGSADAHTAYAVAYLIPMALLNDAEWEIRRALELDPLSSWTNFVAGYIVQMSPGRESEALNFYDKALEINPGFSDIIWDRGMALAFAGRRKEALAAFQKYGGKDWTTGPVEWALVGEKDKALELTNAAQKHLDPMDLARAYAMLGRSSEALDQLDIAIRTGNRQIMFAKVDRRLTNLHGNPRFQDLLKRIGLETQ